MKHNLFNSILKISLVSFGLVFIVTACGPAPQSRKTQVRRTCAECHPDKADALQSGVVHQPTKEKNCEACHLPHGTVPTILLRQPLPVICLTCHAGFKAAPDKKSWHEPFNKGECDSCHEPHNSEFPKLLNTAVESLCFNCHDREPFARQTVHAPVQEGCASCHLSHMSDYTGLLISSENELCASCHETGASGFVAAHQGYPVTTGCVKCHAQHSSSDPGLLREVVHAPVRSGDCNDCHQLSGTKIGLKSSGTELCLSCHDDVPGAAKHAPVQDGDCQACHAEHASEYADMLSEAPTSVCLNCHDHGQKKPGLRSAHDPVAKGDCLACHNGHTAAGEALLKSEAPDVCYSCHAKEDLRRHPEPAYARPGRALSRLS